MGSNKPPFAEWIRDHVFSATELENYQACPYRFWAQHYLETSPRDSWTIELSPRDRGTLLHRVLEKTFQEFAAQSSLETPQVEILQRQASKHLDTEIQKKQSELPSLSPFLLSRQKESMERALKNFISGFWEEKAKRRRLLPQYFEWGFGHRNPPLKLCGGSILFKGRIDRIDVDAVSKTFLVVDYKTSGGTTGSQILSGRSFQLPLYILAVKRLLLPDYEPIGGLYCDLGTLEQKDGLLHADRLPDFIDLHPSSSTIVPAGVWDRFFEETESRVADVVAEIRQGHFPSKKEPCEDYCPYQDICRLRSLE